MFRGFLRQSTASQTRTIGPFIDDADAITPDDGLTIANTDIRVKKNGAADAAKNSGGATADVNGMYAVTWDATDTNTIGELQFSVKVAGALYVGGYYTVLEEEVYDDLFAASAVGYLKPTVGGRDLDVSAGGEAGIDWANVGTPGSTVSLSATTVSTVTTTTTAVNLTNAPTNGDLTATMKTSAQTAAAAAITAASLPTAAQAAAAVLTTAMTESYSTAAGTKTLAQALYELGGLIGRFAISGTTLTVYALDGTTPAATFTLDDATAPTAIERTT